jgi:hypothetical protein
MCFELEEPFIFVRGPEEDAGGDIAPFAGAGGAGVGAVGGGDEGESEVKRRSDESRTAESTRMSAIRCSAGVTSAGFHSSSSTNFADCDIRDWWKVCKNTFAYIRHTILNEHHAKNEQKQSSDEPG